MHEAVLVGWLLEAAQAEARRHSMVRISRLKLRLGAFRMAVPELIQSAFTVLSHATVAQDAVLEIEQVPLLGCCSACGLKQEVIDWLFLCSQCGASLTEIVSGQELDLVEIEGQTGSP